MSRIMSLTYGSVVYMIFFGCFVYAIGFLADFGVPKTINSGEPGAFFPALMINAALLGVFALQHTGMARATFKRWLTKMVPAQMERSTYVLATCIAFGLLFWLWQPMPEVVWSVQSATGQAVVYGISLLGWMTVLVATIMIHHFDLFGMRQVWMHARGESYKELGFRTPGFYKYVRHPIQVGFLIAFWATPTMTVGHLVFALACTGYIAIAVKFFEERDLIRIFGDTYRRYMAQVPGFFPLRGFRAVEPAAATVGQTAQGESQA